MSGFCLYRTDNLLRTLLRTLAASGTFLLINMRNIIRYSDSACLTDLLTHLTSDTAHLAGLHNDLAHISGTALYSNLCIIRNQLN